MIIIQRSKTQRMVLCALLAALTAVFSQLAIPLGPVPINLALLAVFCAGAFLGSKLGALSLLIWVLLGLIGLPVFSMLRGGLGILLGPTGGYIAGYIPAAYITGLIIEKFGKNNQLHIYCLSMSAGLAICYSSGTIWLMHITNTKFIEALAIGVIPFIPGDILKIAAGALLVRHLHVSKIV